MLNEALSAIVNLLKLKKEAKKTDLEIEKLERERKKDKGYIHIASFEDIKAYDHRAREILENAERLRRDAEVKASPRRAAIRANSVSRPNRAWWLILVFGLAYLLYKCAA